jgi:hypothetical protein
MAECFAHCIGIFWAAPSPSITEASNQKSETISISEPQKLLLVGLK